MDSAYRRPAISPARSTESTASRTANGETIPSSVIGTENSAIEAKKEPRKAPTDASANAPTAAESSGSDTNGITAIAIAAHMISRHMYDRLGWRSASRPPQKYPIDR